MERSSRRKFTADFKAKVVVEALKERSTIEELARKYELHPNQITTWKKAFLANASAAFGGNESEAEEKKRKETELEQLYAEIGKLKVQNEFLKKNYSKAIA
jgi:transposase